MKYLIFIFLMSGLSFNLSFSQMANGSNSSSSSSIKHVVKIINTHASVRYVNTDFNKDGRKEILKGESIIKLAEGEYWVKNTTLTSEEGDVFTFNNKLRKNGEPVIRQVTAEYGYIIIFIPDSDYIEVYLASESGSKDSDVIFIEM